MVKEYCENQKINIQEIENLGAGHKIYDVNREHFYVNNVLYTQFQRIGFNTYAF